MKDLTNLKSGSEFDVVLDNKKPRRPALPLLLICACALWLTCSVSFIYLRTSADELSAFLVPLLVAVALFAFLGIFKGARAPCLIIAFALLGVVLGVSENSALVLSGDKIVSSGQQNFTATLVEDATKSDFGSTTTIKVKDAQGKEYRLVTYFSDENDLLTGEKIEFSASCKSLKESSKDYDFNKGICATVSVGEWTSVSDNFVMDALHSARKLAIANFSEYSGASAGLLQALVCGYRNTIKDDGTYDQFRICGLAHVVAVSGAHLAIVVAVFLFFLKKLKAPRILVATLSTLFVLLYLIFSGIPISAIRSSVMVVLGLVAGLFGRRATPINALALAVVGFIVLDPTACVSVSLFLSAASTLGIMLFAGLIGSWFDVKNEKVDTFLVQPTSLTLASNLMTLPYSAALFSQISTISILTNIVATPLFSVACVMGLVCACVSLFVPPLAGFLGFLAMCFAFPLKISVEWMSAIPHAVMAVSFDVVLMLIVSGILCTLLLCFWPQFKRKQVLGGLAGVVTVVLFVLFFPQILPTNEIVFLDVGQGDAILLKSGTHAILVDTGNQKTKLKESLAKQGVNSLDAVIITHHDDDHMGCLEDLKTYETIFSVYTSKNAQTCACKGCAELRSLAEGASSDNMLRGLSVNDTISVGAFKCKVIWPKNFEDEGGNSDSVSLLITSDENADGEDEFSLLMTGDAEKESIKKMIKESLVGDVDVLKVPHHGSKVGVDDDVLDVLKPENAVISVGANNRYGHPKAETLSFLQNHSVQVLRTDENGAITLKPKLPKGYVLQAEK